MIIGTWLLVILSIMSNKTIIIAIMTILAVSFINLSVIEERAADPTLDKNWWALYFQDPHGDNLDFTIENHSNKTDFTYEIASKDVPVLHESVTIPKGESTNIHVDQTAGNTKTTITVRTDAKDKKEIYK